MANDIRERILSALENELLDKDVLIMALLKGMSLSDLERIVKANELFMEFPDEDSE